MISNNTDRKIVIRTTFNNVIHDETLSVSLTNTVYQVKSMLKDKGLVSDEGLAKLIFSGRVLSNSDTFAKVLENYTDRTITPTIHLVGGVSVRPNKAEEIEVERTTPSMPTAPSPNSGNQTSLLQKQLLVQQQMMKIQMMMNQLILVNSPTIHSAPAGSAFNTNVFSSLPTTPLSPLTANVFQQNQSIFNAPSTPLNRPTPQPVQTPTPQQQPQQPAQQQPQVPEQQEQPAQQQNVEQPQRLIDNDENAQQAEGNLFYTFLKVLLVSTVIFSKQSWTLWALCTVGFFLLILLLQYINSVIHARVVREQERRDREEQARIESERIEQEGGNLPENIATTVQQQVDRGVFGTLMHIIYLFFISLAPTYQPRRAAVVPEDEQHED